jgi:hypothetical protein
VVVAGSSGGGWELCPSTMFSQQVSPFFSFSIGGGDRGGGGSGVGGTEFCTLPILIDKSNLVPFSEQP